MTGDQITTTEELEAFARFAIETLQSERRTDTDDGDSWAAEQIEDAAPTLAALDGFRPDRPIGVGVEVTRGQAFLDAADKFGRAAKTHEDDPDTCEHGGFYGRAYREAERILRAWAEHGGPPFRSVAPPSGVVSPEQVEALMRGRLKWASTHWDVPDDECLRALAEAIALGLRVEGELGGGAV